MCLACCAALSDSACQMPRPSIANALHHTPPARTRFYAYIWRPHGAGINHLLRQTSDAIRIKLKAALSAGGMLGTSMKIEKQAPCK
jgi:hypothetical protein